MIASPRPASTVVLIRPRDAEGGWETYLLRRSSQSPVHADLWVFPGGTLRLDDLTPQGQALCPDFPPEAAHAALSRPPGGPPATPRESLGYFIAAARELFEEAGVILGASGGRGVAAHPDVAGRWAEPRRALEEGRPLAQVAAELGVSLALQDLTYYAHWITPEAVPQRFDTRFFLAVLPDGQTASPSPFEMAEGAWIDVPTALERSKEGALALHFATLSHLRRLVPYATVAELLAFARSKPVVPVMPHARETGGRIVPSLPPELDGAW